MTLLVGGFQKSDGAWEKRRVIQLPVDQKIPLKYLKDGFLTLPTVIKDSNCRCSVNSCIQNTQEVRSSGSSIK